MSDDGPEPGTREIAIPWCPGCDPDRDPFSDLLIEDRCGYHRPSLAGLDDARLDPPGLILGTNDTDPETQHGMAALLRGQ